MMNTVLMFDYDDTLVQTRECKFAAIRALALRSYGMSLTNADIERHWGKPYPRFFGDLFDADGPGLNRLLQQYESLNNEFPMRLHPDAQSLIHHFLPSVYSGIVSSASRQRILMQLQELDVPEDRFDFIQGAEQTPVHKPDPRVFQPALAAVRKHHEPPIEIIYVGDADSDFRAASGAGLRFIGIARNEQSRAQLQAAGAQVLDSLDQLPAAI